MKGSELVISITDPIKVDRGIVGSYIAYKVNTVTSLKSFHGKKFSVLRRFSDFCWLRSALVQAQPEVPIPPLPEKALINRFAEFIETRRDSLEGFIRRCADHSTIRNDPIFRSFLTADEKSFDDAKAEMKKVQAAGGSFSLEPSDGKSDSASSSTALSGADGGGGGGVHRRSAKRAALRASRVQKLEQHVAPTFGISPFKLFPLMAGCILVCAYDAMPFGFSELWLIPLLALVLAYFTVQKQRQDKRAALGIVADKDVLALVAKEMPAWFSYKDVETIGWLNAVLESLWPFVDQGVSDQLTEEVVPPLVEGLVPGLRIELTKLTLGSVAPKITSVTASHASKSEVHLDLEIKWSSDVYALLEIGFRLAPFPLELQDITFSSKLRVRLSPLIPMSPYIGAIQLAFLEKPHIDFRFKIGGLDAMSVSVPGLLDVALTVSNAIKGALQGLMVYPTYLVIPLADEKALGAMELTRPPPQGVLRFTVVKATSLPRMDKSGIAGMGSRTSSDPYVRAQCGDDPTADVFTTETILHNLNPRWPATTSTFDVLVWDPTITELNLTVVDWDKHSDDDIIGTAFVQLKELTPNEHEFHELSVRLSDGAKKDKKALNTIPKLYVTTKYFPCKPLAGPAHEEEEGGEGEEGGGAGDGSGGGGGSMGSGGVRDPFGLLRSPRRVRAETVGILVVKNLELSGVQSNAGANLVGEKIFMALDCLGTERTTIERVNKASPASVTWMKSFFFVVTSTSQVFLRIQVLHKPGGGLKSVSSAVAGAVNSLAKVGSSVSGSSDSGTGEVLGEVEFSLAELINSSGTLEIHDMYFGSEHAHGEISCSLEYMENGF